MLTEQVVTECESLGRGPAEHGSGSQSGIERERERRDFAFHPICTHSLLHGSSFLSELQYSERITLPSWGKIRFKKADELQFSVLISSEENCS